MNAQRLPQTIPYRAVLATDDDVAVLDAVIAILSVADLMVERRPDVIALRDRLAGKGELR